MNRSVPPEAPRNCPLCPRLVAYRAVNARENPDWFNGAAASFGDPQARLLIAGLAPGRTRANRTGRPRRPPAARSWYRVWPPCRV